MSSGARRGASAAVVACLTGASGAERSRTSEGATCPLCKGVLRFSFGEYGQTLEACDTRRCPNATPHHPQPDPNAGTPKFREPKKRPSTGRPIGRPPRAL